MEMRLLHGLEPGAHESPLHFLACTAAATPLPDETLSIAVELIVAATREYTLLRLQPRLVAACCVHIAVGLSSDGTSWSDRLAACCGYPSHAVADAREAYFQFWHGTELRCRSLASGEREKTIVVSL